MSAARLSAGEPAVRSTAGGPAGAAAATMAAVRMEAPGGPEVLRLQSVALPQPGPGEVLVQAHTIGVGRPDCMVRRGTYKWMPPLPCTPGNEMSGTVEALGAGVANIHLGQPVLVSSRELSVRGGCYAQYVAIPAHAAILLPHGLDLSLAPALPNYQVAWALLHRAAVRERVQTLYLNGAAGGVGTAVLQLARELGIRAIAGASSAAKREAALQEGAAAAIEPDGDAAARIRALTDGRGVDLVLDHLGGAGLAGLVGALAPFGTLVSYNLLAGPPQEDVFQALRSHIGQAPGIRCFNMHTFDHDQPGRRALLAPAIDWMARVRIRPRVHARLPLSEAAEAHRLMEERAAIGKIMLDPWL
ncbi:zinc-binding dehydrogenase [Paracidovorax cattleyae]|uniref:NADPH2:quinone reductase n=1 Tax=Paracidovorax cattleyae TaxID=80868 RepID=A0A1H0WB38_9BURK|nr:zinc-binding dehydrogenase [Paracidovorax cattleyae]SDP87828.1 NADPH2:quinone reductase [Paracidovorax cattleyae]